MSQENVEIVHSIYSAWQRGDFSSADWAHPEIEYVIADGPSPGRWTGLAGLGEGARSWIGAWEEFTIEAEEFRELDSQRVLVLTHAHGRGKTSGLEVGQIAGSASGGGFAAGPRSAQEQITMLQQALRNEPPTADRYALLGNAYLQRARETADASLYGSAEQAFAAGRKLDRSSAGVLAGFASLRLAQHDFAAGLRLARRAHTL